MVRMIRRAARRLARDWQLAAGTAVTTAAVLGAAGTLWMFHLSFSRPLPVAHPEELHAIRILDATGSADLAPAPLRDELAAAVPALGAVCSRNAAGLSTVKVDATERSQVVELLGPGCLQLLGIAAAPGAFAAFDRAATIKGEPLVAFASDRFARTALNGLAQAVGRMIKVGTDTVEVVGVLPPSFTGLKRDIQSDLILPGLYHSTTLGSASEFLVRVEPRSVRQVSAQLAASWPEIVRRSGSPRLTGTRPAISSASSGFSSLQERYGQPLILLERLALAIVGFGVVSLAAMFGLSLARRRMELQVRRALGAGTRRLVLASIAPVVFAAGVGGLLAVPTVKVLTTLAIRAVWTGLVPLDLDVAMTPWRAAMIAGAAIAIAVLSVVPTALLAIAALPNHLRADASVTGRSRARQWLLTAEIAVCVVFVAAATMFASALLKLSSTPLGFRPAVVYFARATPRPGGYTGLVESEYFPATLEALTRVPGVESASMSRYFTIPLVPPLSPVTADGAEARAIEDVVSPRFFETVGIDRVSGRDFTWSDTVASPQVASISESLARQLFGRTDVLGRQVAIGPAGTQDRVEIVGVVRDAMYGTVRTPERRVIYRPSLQRPSVLRAPLYQVRAASAAHGIAAVFGATIGARGREAVVGSARLSDSLRQSMLEERLLSAVGGTTAGLALLLALIGLYAHLSFAVDADTRELAIRAALGATRSTLGWVMLRRGLIVTLAGALVGVPMLFVVARVARHLVPSLGGISAFQIGAGLIAAVAVGVVASLGPALRASRSDTAALMKGM